ncbi:hypothetical protein BD769DRAFT_1457161, partial [Suillus cothurnatus]
GISSRSSSLTTICNNQWIIPKSHCNSGSIIQRSIQICTGGTSTSTAVEHVFSQGRHLLHFTRNRLCPSSIVHSSVLAHGSAVIW